MISVKDISKSYGRIKAVDSVSFDLAMGETLVIVGPSGSGKTTLLRLIAGLEAPDNGAVEIDGRMVSVKGWVLEPNRRGLGYVFQSPALWPHMTVGQNILFGLDASDARDSQARVTDLLNKLGLEGFAKRRPDEISRGEARRVSIARTLAPRPSRLLMDEALTNIDPELKTKVMGVILDEVAENGASLIYVTHDRDEADVIQGKRMEMKDGCLG